MKREDLLSLILDAIPHRIVFVDTIRYLDKRAKFHYYQERGYGELIGRSILECHADQSSKQIEAMLQRLDDHGDEEFPHVTIAAIASTSPRSVTTRASSRVTSRDSRGTSPEGR